MADLLDPLVVHGLYRYPIKAFSPEPLDEVWLTEGQTVPGDRAYSIEIGSGRFDPNAPRHLPKINFLTLMRDEKLAALGTRFDDATETISISRHGRTVVQGRLSTTTGRHMVEQFLSAYLGNALRGAPKVQFSEGHSFSDVAEKCLHIISLASLRVLERDVGKPIDPLRFRPNLIIDGGQPWAEFAWIGGGLKIGAVALSVFKRTERCAATNVEPGTGQRDMAIPSELLRWYGHSDFGVYAKVSTGGLVRTGMPVMVRIPS